MATRIYTRAGDAGETGLFGGRRVAKDDLRVEACGAVDELNAALGIARALALDEDLRGLLALLQSELLVIGADLGAPTVPDVTRKASAVPRVTAESVEVLEREIDRLDGELPTLTRFILPGGTPLAAALHLARAICRRAERRTVTLARSQTVNPEALRYLNRLSDLLFVMARAANYRGGEQDVVWEP